MSDKNYITSFCSIKSSEVIVNSTLDFSDKNVNNVDFLKSVYKHYQMAYPKFYKMDSLCKLAFVASELLLKANKVTEKYSKEEIAIVIANNASSLETDTEYQKTIETSNYFPSPTIFVYTLPNILIGEIAIRNGIKGENTFFVTENFDAELMTAYANSMLNSGSTKCCITGWVDYFEDNITAFLYIVEKQAGPLNIEHSSEQLMKLYNQS